MITGYHVTPRGNVQSILTKGLEPRRGARARAYDEDRPGVFLFTDRAAAESAVGGWLGEEFSERTPLTLLRVTLPDEMEADRPVGWEIIVRKAVPPQSIKVVRRAMLGAR